MRRTLSVVAMTAALLVPTTAALAASGSNASCNNGKGGNSQGTYNEKGNTSKVAASGLCGVPPYEEPVEDDGGNALPGENT